MKLPSMRSWAFALVATVVCEHALASDWYVDAVNGNNANSGTTPTSAWRTIKWAIANAPTSGVQTIHVAAGTYDTALGETFPFVMRNDLQVIGGGTSATHIQIPPGQVGFSMFSPPDYFYSNTVISDLHIVGGSRGISLYTTWNPISPTLRNLEIEQASTGIYVFSFDQFAAPYAAPTIQSIDVHHCGLGLDFVDQMTGSISDSNVHDNSSHGVRAEGFEYGCRPTFRRCRIERNGANGIYAHFVNYGGVYAEFEDCSVSFNAQCGWFAPPYTGLYGGAFGEFVRSTIANNGTVGVSNVNSYELVTLKDSIVWGNADDIAANISATRCDIGEPVTGASNFSLDPLFENAVAGDLRLRFGSPCLDLASIVPPAGALDLAGRTRDVDGDLNTSEVCDLGALEFRPLELVGTAQLGALITLELRGPQGASSTLYWTRAALAATPMNTQFGQLDLQPSLAHVYRVLTVDPVVPAIVQRSIPNSAFLVGRTFAFQSLADNPFAPAGKAYTNPVQFTILP